MQLAPGIQSPSKDSSSLPLKKSARSKREAAGEAVMDTSTLSFLTMFIVSGSNFLEDLRLVIMSIRTRTKELGWWGNHPRTHHTFLGLKENVHPEIKFPHVLRYMGVELLPQYRRFPDL